ncbi:MAG: FAD-dependent oxidoreductase [Xylophilus sp.]|nr:FAD-dependent oxidoreductase [Xylophilus sp.]MBP6617146.1 FAD-dependent oxidoreductase [Burkholderiaceae bacterium]MBP6651043.1 FAD-dependent oxidoreductase [Xylophilus sp.]
MRVAVVGSGIAGLGAAHALRGKADISLFEAGAYFGGHTHTVDVTLPDAHGNAVSHGVDTGFLVFNERTYPEFIALLKELDVSAVPSDMSFSVQVPRAQGRALEWSGTSLNTVFAQRANLLRPAFWRMLRDLLRFNKLVTDLATRGAEASLTQPLAEFLQAQKFSAEFRDWYLLPMLGCIWSCPTDQMLQFPVATMVRFCHNHGLAQVSQRPQWWTVAGGARHYVDKITAGITDKRLNTPVRQITRDARGVAVTTDTGTERFDRLVLATHSDQALALLGGHATAQERQVLGAIHYQPNRAVLHTDTRVLPRNPSAWAAWNYEAAHSSQTDARVCLHYLINRLQPVPFQQPVVVSLNPVQPIADDQVLGSFDYAHPVFDLAAIRAQAEVPALQGRQHTYFAGAWMGYGFHEDGLKAGRAAASQLLADMERPEAQAA